MMSEGKLVPEHNVKRLNIVLPEQTVERIEALKNITAASSVTDVIRSAILTYEALVEYLSEGNQFYLKKDDEPQFSRVRFLFDLPSKSLEVPSNRSARALQAAG